MFLTLLKLKNATKPIKEQFALQLAPVLLDHVRRLAVIPEIRLEREDELKGFHLPVSVQKMQIA